VTELTRASSLSRPTVSHHLKLLCEAGVLERTRHGREIHFRLQADTLIQRLQTVIDYLDAHR
jgi:ArsR family transcriptional regulator, arsenate/arsenite/antimonite-responsive transcriptional repressor